VTERRKITRSRLRCLLCDDVIESKNTHDYRTCGCGNAMIDGGRSYIRYGAMSPDTIELLTEYAE
jgi:hypothetical protein